MELINCTIQESFKHRVEETPKSMAYYFNGFQYTWEEMGKIVASLVSDLKKKNIKKGDKVGLLSINSDGWLFYFYALQVIGAKAVLLNTALTIDEIIRNIEFVEIDYLCYGEGYKHNFEDLLYRLDLICMRDSFKGNIKIEDDPIFWQEKIKKNESLEIAEVSPDEVCCFLFTSGTTKAAKAVMLTHYNLVNNSRAIAEAMHWTAEDRMCVAVPFFHCFGLTACILAGLQTNFPLYVLPHYRTIHVCKTIEDYQCTILNGVPSMFLAMKNNPKRVEFNIDSVRSGIIAGSPIFEHDYYEVCKMFNSEMHLQISYGQTESSPCITIANYDDDIKTKATSVGKVIEHVQLEVFDSETEKKCNINERGMIKTKGYHVMKGYYGNPEETQKVLRDGWLITGDIGYLDENNYLHISGRKKNLIIRGGENIAPEEIEYYIRQIEGVDIVKVMGIPSAVVQEEIAAVISPVTPMLTSEKIKLELKKHLADYKIPKYIYFMDEIEKSASGKINEKKLMQIILRKIKEES